uniref:Uncharacterized protein n=1 Tax=Anguilla anguilla TaxID=7936 RepID=A0A0E9TLB5_ANGAN
MYCSMQKNKTMKKRITCASHWMQIKGY